MKLNPRSTLPAARHVARRTRPRPAYAPPAALVMQPPPVEQRRLLGHEWPFPQTVIRGRLVENRFSPRLCMTLEVLRCFGVPVGY